MKKQLIIAIAMLVSGSVLAQEKAKSDTIVLVKPDSAKARGTRGKTVIQVGNIKLSTGVKGTEEIQVGNIKLANGDNPKLVVTEKTKKTVSMGLVFNRIDLGFSRYLDQGSFTLSAANSFLDFEPAKTSNFGFDFFEMKFRPDDNFNFFIAAGLDWNHIRLQKNVTIQKDQPVLTAIEDNVEFSKNRFSSRYLRIPIGFDFSSKMQNGKRFHVVVGPELGFLLNGKLKQISKERGKEKFKDDYNFNPFRYGAFARIGYSNTGIFAKYYFNDVFAKDQGPKDFKNLSFGFTWGF